MKKIKLISDQKRPRLFQPPVMQVIYDADKETIDDDDDDDVAFNDNDDDAKNDHDCNVLSSTRYCQLYPSSHQQQL